MPKKAKKTYHDLSGESEVLSWSVTPPSCPSELTTRRVACMKIPNNTVVLAYMDKRRASITHFVNVRRWLLC